MDENHPSLDVQDRRFEEKDPAFDENHSELNDFISGPEGAYPHFEQFTSDAWLRKWRAAKRPKRRKKDISAAAEP